MKRLLSLLTAMVLCGLIFASCQINADINNGGTNRNESEGFSESVSESKENDSESSGERISEIEDISEDKSDAADEDVHYITLDYNGYGEKNEVKNVTVKKGEKISGLPEKVYSSSNSDFEYWSYNGKKIKNGMVYDYDYDITIIANYSEWTNNY